MKSVSRVSWPAYWPAASSAVTARDRVALAFSSPPVKPGGLSFQLMPIWTTLPGPARTRRTAGERGRRSPRSAARSRRNHRPGLRDAGVVVPGGPRRLADQQQPPVRQRSRWWGWRSGRRRRGRRAGGRDAAAPVGAAAGQGAVDVDRVLPLPFGVGPDRRVVLDPAVSPIAVGAVRLARARPGRASELHDRLPIGVDVGRSPQHVGVGRDVAEVLVVPGADGLHVRQRHPLVAGGAAGVQLPGPVRLRRRFGDHRRLVVGPGESQHPVVERARVRGRGRTGPPVLPVAAVQ